MPISSLPSEGGIGTLGKEAFEFAEKLSKAGQSYWQILPIGPMGKGDSPYQPLSAFAGSELFIDPERLCEDGLLTKEELPKGESRFVNYSMVRRQRESLLRLAFSRFKPSEGYSVFCKENEFWLDPYALFMAIRKHYKGKPLSEWDEADRCYCNSVKEKYAELYIDQINYHKFCQYRFFADWDRLHTHCAKLGVKIMGDMPIYVSPDGADVWTSPEQFELDERQNPVNVAGVPPDAFSETGQRWNNPLYRWDVMNDDGFSWWKMRVKMASKLFDAVRIDHFIGMARYYSIPQKSENAIGGRWRRGPGRRLIDAINSARGEMEIVAENLGEFHPSAQRLLEYSGYPGMEVVQFSFGEDGRPYDLNKNTVIYGGTHDNDTLLGWIGSLDIETKQKVLDYIGAKSNIAVRDGLFRHAYASPCCLAIFQMQDVLWLGSAARMNTPGTASGNWRWRMQKGAFDDATVSRLAKLSRLYGRIK